MPDIFDASRQSELETQQPVPKAPPVSLTQVATSVKESAASPDFMNTENVGTTDMSAETHAHYKNKNVDEYSSVMRAEKASNNALKAYLPKPTKIAFDSQQADEHVLLLLRSHPVTQLRWMFIALLLVFVPFLLGSIGFFDFLSPRFQFAAMTIWYLLLIGYVLQSFLSWFYNVFLITDERIIDVDFHNLLYKNISSAKISNIQDITASAGGIVASAFNYGTVRVQTAGSAAEFEFEDVPQPAKVTAFLNEMILEEEQEQIDGRVS